MAELELTDERDRKLYEGVLEEVNTQCRPELVPIELQEADGLKHFPNESILCPNRGTLDDSREAFVTLIGHSRSRNP